jgi:hypothetical protein
MNGINFNDVNNNLGQLAQALEALELQHQAQQAQQAQQPGYVTPTNQPVQHNPDILNPPGRANRVYRPIGTLPNNDPARVSAELLAARSAAAAAAILRNGS